MSSTKGIRELGRELAFISVYLFDMSQVPLDELTSFEWYEKVIDFDDENGELFKIPPQLKKDLYNFSGRLINGVVSNLNKIDNLIKKHLVKWSFERLHSVDKAILRLSIYSLIYQFDIPSEVTISEANELSEKYCDDNTSNYINGILHKIKIEFRKNFILDNKTNKKQIKLKKKQ